MYKSSKRQDAQEDIILNDTAMETTSAATTMKHLRPAREAVLGARAYMSGKLILFGLILSSILVCGPATLRAQSLPAEPPSRPLEFDLRRLRRMDTGVDQWVHVSTHALWEPSRTAAVVCDMWTRHEYKKATARVAEMAPRINDAITELRRRGVLIIHCPSGAMKDYEGTPGRKLAQTARPVETTPPLQAWCGLDPARESPLPIDDSDGGCDDDPPCQLGTPCYREIDTLQIKEGDAITDSAEAFFLMRQRGITNVIVMGIHENMCVLGRPFAIRQMVDQGQNVVLIRDLTDTVYNPQKKPYVDHFTSTDLMTWHIEKYWCPTITSDQIIGGSPFRFSADTNAPRIFRNYVKLPPDDGHAQLVSSYVEDTPNPDYSQASDAARAAFREMKFGVRIHWGVYSELGGVASPSFLKTPYEAGMSNEQRQAYQELYRTFHSWAVDSGLGGVASPSFTKMSNEQRQAYQELYRTFNPVNFNADAWMNLFQTNGARIFAFTSKHTDGFSMFDTHTRVRRRVNWTAPGGPQIEDCDFAYSIMDSPFHRDIVKELTDSAHRHNMKIDLYFIHPDWYDADFRPFYNHPFPGRVNKTEHPEQWDHFVQRHRQQLTELLTHYGKIDLICLDEVFDQTAWLDLRQTMKIIRHIQPDVMFRARGIGNYGDYFTPEHFVPGSKQKTDMPWMAIEHLSDIWGYQPDATKYKNGAWIVSNLVDCVAKGGNFMVGLAPDATGNFHPKEIAALQYTGAWLKTNGEAIFNTRPLPGDGWKDGDNLRFTHSELGPSLYAISLQWPGDELLLRTVKLAPGATVRMLGSSETLSWREDPVKGTVISLPARWQSPANHPCQTPCSFKIQGPFAGSFDTGVQQSKD
jgi:alpha-L-fucosidase